MTIEQQVCTLEQAKKLKELGVNQKTLFYWKENEIQTVVSERQMKEWIERYLPTCNVYYPAFTVAELGVMLPASYKAEYGNYGNSCYWYLDLNKHPDLRKGFIYRYHNRFNPEAEGWNNFSTISTNEAQARAAMLIHLLENNLITAAEVNDRLAA